MLPSSLIDGSKPLIGECRRECPKICLQSLNSNRINSPPSSQTDCFSLFSPHNNRICSGEYRLPSPQQLFDIHTTGQPSHIHRYYVSHPAMVYCSSTLTHICVSHASLNLNNTKPVL